MIWRSRGVKFLCVFILTFAMAATFQPNEHAHAFTSQVIQKGATGQNVVELQARLQYIGYYKGAIDGVFGWNTYWALRNFQKDFGLKVDGLAGTDTKQKLVSVSKYDEQWIRKQIRQGNQFTYYGGVPKSSQSQSNNQSSGNQPNTTQPNTTQSNSTTQPNANANQSNGGGNLTTSNSQNGKSVVMPAQNVPEGFSQHDIKLMSRMVYAEAKGEPFIGQVAVAAVILNRINSPKFPNTVSGVIYQPGAFTSVQNGELWVGTPDNQSKKAVIDALNGWDPSDGALYYFNPAKASSSWIWSRPQIKKIGKHIFTK